MTIHSPPGLRLKRLSPKSLPGVQPPLGFWDPLGLSVSGDSEKEGGQPRSYVLCCLTKGLRRAPRFIFFPAFFYFRGILSKWQTHGKNIGSAWPGDRFFWLKERGGQARRGCWSWQKTREKRWEKSRGSSKKQLDSCLDHTGVMKRAEN